MKEFESFLKNGEVKKVSKDFSLAASLNKDLRERAGYILSLKLNEQSAKTIFEGLYEALREGSEAILSLEGYKSYSHEASIQFLKKFPEFAEWEINELDNFRKIRNGSKYYGKSVDVAEVERIKKVFPLIKEKLDKRFNLLREGK